MCLRSAEDLVSTARSLSGASNQRIAFFLVLTAYEELAKCQRILDSAAANHVSQADLVVEDSLFRHHDAKYRITMEYLEQWITVNAALWRNLAQRLGWNLSRDDSDALRGERQEVRERGSSSREACLYVDYQDHWVERLEITADRVERNLRMAESMMAGFRSSLEHWNFAIS